MNDSDNINPWDDGENARARPAVPSIPPPALHGVRSDPPVPPPVPSPSPTAPVGSPVLSGTYGDSRPAIPDAPSGGGGRLAWIGAIVGALMLLVGGGYFALTALNATGGADTPEEAIEKLIEAVNNEDVITLGELLEPGERRTIVDPTINDILPELIRLGVLAEEFDAGQVEGVDLELTDVTYRIDSVPGHDDLVHVAFTGGQASSSSRVDDFPFGDPVRDRFGDSMEDEPPTSESIEESDNPLVLVERNDRWYVSMWYSLGEAVRLEFDERLPLGVERPAALGSPSPEAAVEQFVFEAFDFDLVGMLGRLDPEEADALYRYAPLFLDEAQDAAQQARRDLQDEGVSWDIGEMGFAVDRDSDDALVDLEAFTFTLTTPDVDVLLEYGSDRIFGRLDGVIDGDDVNGTVEITPTRWQLDGSSGSDTIEAEARIDAEANTVTLSGQANGERFTGSLTIDESGDCSEYSFIGFDESEIGCLEELLGEAGAAELSRQQILDWFAFSQNGYPSATFSVHETDGEWYLSPTLTVMHAVASGLRGVDQAEFDEFLDALEEANGDEAIRLEDVLEAPFDAADGIGGLDGGVFDLPFGNDDVSTSTGTIEAPIIDRPGAPPDSEFIVTPGATPTRYRDELGEPGERHVYLVGMSEGQELGVTLYGESVVGDGGLFDPLLTVETPDGFNWDVNDDFDGLNSGLRFTATESGTWRILVEDLGGSPGGYELTLQLPATGTSADIGPDPSALSDDVPAEVPPEVEAVIDDFEEITITIGETLVLTGAIAVETFDVYAFEAPAGTTFTVTLVAQPGSFLDPVLFFRDADLEVIAENDDAPPDAGLAALDSQIVVNADRTDAYYVEVRSFGAAGQGSYTLTIDPN